MTRHRKGALRDKKIGLRIPTALLERLKVAAEADRRTVSDYIVLSLEYLCPAPLKGGPLTAEQARKLKEATSPPLRLPYEKYPRYR